MVYRISKGVETAKEWHKSEDGLECINNKVLNLGRIENIK
jgi:hypothetical protein